MSSRPLSNLGVLPLSDLGALFQPASIAGHASEPSVDFGGIGSGTSQPRRRQPARNARYYIAKTEV